MIAGIDVAKAELVIYINEAYYTVTNSEKSLKQWLIKHKKLVGQVSLFAFEPTGGYERVLAKVLKANQLPACCIHANHVRAYAKSLGYLAKTDKIDAKIIAEFAQVKGLTASSTLVEHEQLQALMNRREQYLCLIKQENNRLETLDDEWVIRDINAHIKYLKKQLEKLETQISEYVCANTQLKGMVELITSIPGVGFITAISLLIYLPEIFEADEKELSALSGLAPMNQDSGKMRKKRRIQGGRAQIRRVLYMSALSAKQWNPVIKTFYERLTSKGKVFKVAITAAMRKLLMIIRSVVRRETPWQETVIGC